MTSRERLLAAARGEVTGRPPVWLMRQAGRYLPEYRALKEKHRFVEMVRTPELATEVTLQPMRRFPLDAAIVFSDILVVPEAMGQPYHFKDEGGIAMDYVLDSAAAVHALVADQARERLDYVPQALRAIREALGSERGLLGFCGAPWTLATYMVEGGHPGRGARIAALRQDQPVIFRQLMAKITQTCGDYLEMQIEAGVDAVQIFESWGGLCDSLWLEEGSLCWMAELVRRVAGRVPVIVFCRGQAERLHQVAARTGAPVISVEHGVDLAEAAGCLPAGTAVQGNLDPDFLTGEPGPAAVETRRIACALRRRGGHIFNLGHGITPQARVETVGAVIDAVVTLGEDGGEI